MESASLNQTTLKYRTSVNFDDKNASESFQPLLVRINPHNNTVINYLPDINLD